MTSKGISTNLVDWALSNNYLSIYLYKYTNLKKVILYTNTNAVMDAHFTIMRRPKFDQTHVAMQTRRKTHCPMQPRGPWSQHSDSVLSSSPVTGHRVKVVTHAGKSLNDTVNVPSHSVDPSSTAKSINPCDHLRYNNRLLVDCCSFYPEETSLQQHTHWKMAPSVKAYSE